jgi:chemotaxis protein CheY-P-specific phosphatase CheC
VKTNSSEILTNVFCEVLEQVAFMFGEISKSELLEEQPLEHPIVTKIQFAGHHSGTLTCAAPVALCRELAASMLGADDDETLTEAQSIDAFKELVNVTCGNFLTVSAGEELIFDLSVPVAAPLEVTDWNTLLKTPSIVALMLEEHPVVLLLETDHE